MRAAERERDQLVNDLDTILNDNRKAASAQDMLKFMETADQDKYEGFEEVRDAVQNYQDAVRDKRKMLLKIFEVPFRILKFGNPCGGSMKFGNLMWRENKNTYSKAGTWK